MKQAKGYSALNGWQEEIKKRRTFCIISHPDAGKTTTTEKLLLFGGAIQMAGTVKSRKSKKFATSDWMAIEKQRGISVTSSVMQFVYNGYRINLLDTPGHQDFLEDTYRAITAVDSALMVLDGAKGVEAQTIKLWDACRMQNIPVIAFINKFDRDVLPPLDLMDEIEKTLKMESVAVTWPIGGGREFKGVYDRLSRKIRLFSSKGGFLPQDEEVITVDDPDLLNAKLGEQVAASLKEDLKLLDSVGAKFSRQKYLQAKQVPVFFGSAINNFGVKELLDTYLEISSPPLTKNTTTRKVAPTENSFSGFVFKIQANMDKHHRDRIAFIRICSGCFTKGMKVYHCRLKREFKITNPIIFNARQRDTLNLAYPGDVIGLVDTNNFQIGDALSAGENLTFIGIPRFSPEYFSATKLNNPLKIKQLEKGLQHLFEEGTLQLFKSLNRSGYVLGVVGRLQFEVVKFRLWEEYGVDCEFLPLPYKLARWFKFQDSQKEGEFKSSYSGQIYQDQAQRNIFLANSSWDIDYVLKKYPSIVFFDNSDQASA